MEFTEKFTSVHKLIAVRSKGKTTSVTLKKRDDIVRYKPNPISRLVSQIIDYDFQTSTDTVLFSN